jgi:hypothetical protein
MDTKDAALGNWSHNNDLSSTTNPFGLAGVEGTAKTYQLTDGKMAGQTLAGLIAAEAGGKLTQDVATRIIDTPTLSADLKPDERALLDHLRTHGTLAAYSTVATGVTTPAYKPPGNAPRF